MINYRSALLAVTAGAASLSVAACSAGITTASSPTTSAPAPTRSASVAATASSPASSGRMITISGSVGSFPVPAGARVAESGSVDQQIIVVFGSVSPANVSSFYAVALPRAGYVISGNALSTESGVTVAFITFSGRGYKGNIDALSKAPDSGGSLAGYPTKNVTTITLARK
jgi:hypothetical protein